jgi:hypothetical protein
VSLPRPLIHVAIVGAIVAGVWLGIALYRFLGGA